MSLYTINVSRHRRHCQLSIPNNTDSGCSQLFHSAHGDLWNILGSTIRRFGLTVNDRGLYLRIPDIELLDRKKSMVFLTEKPSEVLNFIGIDEKRWWKPFSSQSEMFNYAAGCKLFWVREKDAEEEEHDVVGDRPAEGQEGGEAGKKKLKHNDRQRMAKRPIFNDWITVFIPKCREEASKHFGYLSNSSWLLQYCLNFSGIS